MDIIEEPLDPAEKMRRDRIVQIEVDALRQVLSFRAGRRFINGLLMRAGLEGHAFTGENNVTNFNFGRQSVATDLKADIKAINGDALILMMREAIEDENYVNGNTRQPDTDEYDPLTGQHEPEPKS